MGCDIHLFTERKKSINGTKKWVNIDNWRLNPYFEENNEDGECQYDLHSVYPHRDYTLFSILADVRNDGGTKVISTPKGLPKDVSEVVKNENVKWGCDGHSHSYLTMKELYRYYKKNKMVKYGGLVDEVGVKQIEAGKMPDWWCMSSTIDSLVWKEWKHENDTIKNFIERLEKHFEDYFYDKERDSEDYRIVFWFDN